MRKGEKRRADILRIAEDLFYAQGYDTTTIQDILDLLDLSKGGFYHHFESKEQLLEAICDEKARAAAQAGQAELEATFGSAVERLNALLDSSNIWRSENADFLGLFIRVAFRDDNVIMRDKFKLKIAEYTLPLMETIIEEGCRSGEFSAPEGIARLVMALIGCLTDDIALLMIGSPTDPPAAAAILELLELYRKAIERMLAAPYGTVVIYQMGGMVSACQLIWQKHARALRAPTLEEM